MQPLFHKAVNDIHSRHSPQTIDRRKTGGWSLRFAHPPAEVVGSDSLHTPFHRKISHISELMRSFSVESCCE